MPDTQRRRGPGTLVPLALAFALAGCGGVRVAGPVPEEVGSEMADAAETAYLDGSADGMGDPAGLEELGDAALEEADGSLPAELDAAEALTLNGLFAGEDGTLPPEIAAEVERDVELFHAGRARANFERWLSREGRYRDLILGELRSAGLPEELLYLAMLESGFSATVVSRAKAVGLWQFMRSTGRYSGLRIDDWVDERRDPVAATRAAVVHLALLHDELGDWALAAAAYNAGLGRVRRAQNGSGAGYFQLVREGRLPAETRSYVPLILAAAHVARNRERYGFTEVAEEPPLAYDTVLVDGRTRLSAVARASGISVDSVKNLNPHLVRGAAPPGLKYPIRVPVGALQPEFGDRLAALPLPDRILPEYREVWVVVKSGDSLWRIARAHGVTLKQLRALNPKVRDIIQPGMRLLVDRTIVTDSQLATTAGQSSARSAGAVASAAGEGHPSSTTAVAPAGKVAAAARATPAVADRETHRVGPGDTMSELAVSLGVSLDDLVRWNGMERARPLRTGEVIRVAPPAAERHRVARGETLTSVARRYGVHINDLVRWNSMGRARPLREGEVLVVSGS